MWNSFFAFISFWHSASFVISQNICFHFRFNLIFWVTSLPVLCGYFFITGTRKLFEIISVENVIMLLDFCHLLKCKYAFCNVYNFYGMNGTIAFHFRQTEITKHLLSSTCDATIWISFLFISFWWNKETLVLYIKISFENESIYTFVRGKKRRLDCLFCLSYSMVENCVNE